MTGDENPDGWWEPRLEPATEADLDALVALDTACFGPQAWSRQAWWEALGGGPWMTLVVRRDDAPIAAAVLLPWPPVATLASLAVHPLHRAAGLGTWVLRRVLRRAAALGARRVVLEVDADNVAALRLYRREGFAVARRFTDGGRARLEMTRRLAVGRGWRRADVAEGGEDGG